MDSRLRASGGGGGGGGGGREGGGGRRRETETERVNLVRVDPQLERHSPRKLVPFTAGRDVVGVDLTLDVHVLVGGNVQELDCDQRLRVVDLRQQRGQPITFYMYHCWG